MLWIAWLKGDISDVCTMEEIYNLLDRDLIYLVLPLQINIVDV